LRALDRRCYIATAAAGLVVAVVVSATVGCGGSEDALHVRGSVQKLRALLNANGVRPDGSAGSVGSARAAFKEFAAIPVDADEVVDEAEGEGFIFQWGTYGRVFGRREPGPHGPQIASRE
jgi:hypothetical protein